jgi:hypothetical protein
MSTNNTYWNNNGIYSNEVELLQEYLYPPQGKRADEKCKTPEGRLLSAISYLYYDEYNNGSCNVYEVKKDDCEWCNGWGYEEPWDDADEDELEDCSYCWGDCEFVSERVWQREERIDDIKVFACQSRMYPELNRLWEEYYSEMILKPSNGLDYDGQDDDIIQDVLEKLVTSVVDVIMLKYKVVDGQVVEVQND